MCGLVGIMSSNMLSRHKDALASLLFLDTLRGKDSTGVAAIRVNADTAILKSTIPGYEFVEGTKLEHHLRLNDFCWIGHNRFGTVGRNIKTNAHPFEILDDQGACMLVGAHNGTLKNKHVLTDHVTFGTDSEALFNEIASTSVEDAIGKIEGAWALTYYDHSEEELRIIRNKERSLFYCYEKGKKTLLWASEMWMLKVACSRHGIEIEEDKVFAFLEDTLYKFPAPGKLNEEIRCERKGGLVSKTPTFFRNWNERTPIGGSHGQSPSRIPEAHKEAAATPQSPTAASSGAIAAATVNTPSGTKEPNSGETPTTENGDLFNDPSNIVKPINNVRGILTGKKYKGYLGVLCTLAELKDQLSGGCGFCETEFLDVNDKYAWLAKGKPVCSKCLEGKHDDNIMPSNVSVH